MPRGESCSWPWGRQPGEWRAASPRISALQCLEHGWSGWFIYVDLLVDFLDLCWFMLIMLEDDGWKVDFLDYGWWFGWMDDDGWCCCICWLIVDGWWSMLVLLEWYFVDIFFTLIHDTVEYKYCWLKEFTSCSFPSWSCHYGNLWQYLLANSFYRGQKFFPPAVQ